MTHIRRTLWGETEKGERVEFREDELLSCSECLVVLGEPGMGKSQLLEGIAQTDTVAICTARQLINRHDPRSLLGDASTIAIDALDEVPAKRDGDAVDAVLQRLGILGYPRFILSCRVGDWQAATSTTAIREQYASLPLQLHLEPLTRDEQLAILASKVGGARAEVILDHFASHGLDFLGNPQTLDMIASLRDDEPLPTSRSALFEQAIDVLRTEHNSVHGRQLSRQAALDAAGAAFSGLILSGSSRIVRTATANLDEGEIHISEVEALDSGNVEKMFSTRLFSGTKDGFSYWHRRIGEFLGAAWLSKSADTSTKRRRLIHLFQSQGIVPASIRGLHAWLVRDPHLATTVIATDPIGVLEYADADALSTMEARALLEAIRRVARENPRFRGWREFRAGSLVSPALCDYATHILLDQTEPIGLRLLLAEQLTSSDRARPFQKALKDILLDPDEIFALRHEAMAALVILGNEEWADLTKSLRYQGQQGSVRLAYELVRDLGCKPFSDMEVVETMLAYDGLTLAAWPRERWEHSLARFWRMAERIPVERLEGILDTLTGYLRELMTDDWHDEYELVGLLDDLIIKQIEATRVDPLRLWAWLSSYSGHSSSRRHRETTIAEWFRSHDYERRAIQRHVILEDSSRRDDEPESSIWRRSMLLSERSIGLHLDEGDVVALLGALDPTTRSDMRWRDILTSIPHRGEVGHGARQAAKPFVAHNVELSAWIDRLADPSPPDWQIRHDEKTRQRAAKRAAQFADHRRDYLANLGRIRAGDLGYLYPLAQAYLGLFADLDNDPPAHERIAAWVGPEVAAAAREGFEVLLTQQPVRPSPARTALSLARKKTWYVNSVIVAALAERVRTRSDPFADIAEGRLMAGLFELWHSALDETAGIPGLREIVEQELKNRGVWEKTYRIYIYPQIKLQLAHVDRLYALMRSEEDAQFATQLALECLQRCPDMPIEAETEMIDRVLHSSSRDSLANIARTRRGEFDQQRTRNWAAVQILTDFDTASERLGNTIDPDLIWHLRARAGDRDSDRRHPIPLHPKEMAWIVTTFREHWPAQDRPTGTISGDTNPWDASEYIYSLISRIGGSTSTDAIEALAHLRDAPADGYTKYTQSVASEQRRKRAEETYNPPSIHQIRSILEACLPDNADDLQAVVLDLLDTAQKWLRGDNVDWYRGFFRENGKNKNEEDCRDELIKMLRAIDSTLEYIPESHAADDKRVDIVVRASGNLILPIEIKGQWHARLWSAADRQLDHLYVNDWRAERGIYLIFWFGSGSPLPKPSDGGTIPADPQQLQERLRATSKGAQDGRIDIVVLDLTRPVLPCSPQPQ